MLAPKKYLDKGLSPLHACCLFLMDQLKENYYVCGMDNLYTSARFFHEAYAGENCFKELKQNCHGTTHIARQIAINTNIQNKINSFLTNDEVEKFEKLNCNKSKIKITYT
jgi:hypothetical protein